MDKQTFKKAFTELLESSEVNEKDIEKFFSKDYVQYADGKKLNYHEFIKHMHTLKKSLTYLKVSMKSIAQENDIIFTNHLISGETKDKKTFSGEVIAEFRISNNQIYYCNELTHMIEGEDENRDLGSRID